MMIMLSDEKDMDNGHDDDDEDENDDDEITNSRATEKELRSVAVDCL